MQTVFSASNLGGGVAVGHTLGGGVAVGGGAGIVGSARIAARLTLVSSTAAEPAPGEAFFAEVRARLKPMSADLKGGVYGVDGKLPKPTSTVTAMRGTSGTIAADVPALVSRVVVWTSALIASQLPRVISMVTGENFQVDADLPGIRCAIDARVGVRGVITSALTTLKPAAASVTSASIRARLPRILSAGTGVTGAVATIQATSSAGDASLRALVGSFGAAHGRLPLLRSEMRAGMGGNATIDARLPLVSTSVVSVVHLVQAMVMVVNTHTGAVMNYENFPFNSFCEIDGVYYGAGLNGMCRVDVGDTDADAALGTVPISAGLSTGLLNLGSPDQKRISDAYLTLHTTGNLDLVVTADEEAKHPSVVAPMTAKDFGGLRQRRIAIPKGLRGTAWRFELRNLVGDAFDFSHLGLNVAASARRI